MKFTSFTRDNLKTVREIIQKSLNEVGDLYGINLQMKNIRFDDYSFRVSLEAQIAEKAGDIKKINFDKVCRVYGFEPGDYGKIFTSGINSYKIVGIKTRNRKYPILAERVKDGRGFKFSPEMVLAIMRISA